MPTQQQLQEQRDKLGELIHRLEMRRIKETDESVLFKLDEDIAEKQAELRTLETQLNRADPGSAGVPPAILPPLRIELGPRMNLEEECALFEQIVRGAESEKRLLLVHGQSGMGKTHLLNLYRRILDAYERDYLNFELKDEKIGVERCLDLIVAHFGPTCFREYDVFASAAHQDVEVTEWQRNLTRKFFIDLDTCVEEPPLFLFFDSYNPDLKEPSFKLWLTETFLPHLQIASPLILIIAGQEEITLLPKLKRCCQPFPLKTLEFEHFRQFAKACRAPIPDEMIRSLYQQHRGMPKLFAELVQSLAAAAGGAL